MTTAEKEKKEKEDRRQKKKSKENKREWKRKEKFRVPQRASQICEFALLEEKEKCRHGARVAELPMLAFAKKYQ